MKCPLDLCPLEIRNKLDLLLGSKKPVVTIINHIKTIQAGCREPEQKKVTDLRNSHLIGGDEVAEPLKDSPSSSRDCWPSFSKSANTPGDPATVRSRGRADLLVHRECGTTYTNTQLEKGQPATGPSLCPNHESFNSTFN